jgi:hypothetical protein
VELTSADALALRMLSLLLRERPGGAKAPTDVAGVVEWFGAMQAQDAASGMWSLGVRLPGFTTDDVQDALERRQAIRTWPMREPRPGRHGVAQPGEPGGWPPSAALLTTAVTGTGERCDGTWS